MIVNYLQCRECGRKIEPDAAREEGARGVFHVEQLSNTETRLCGPVDTVYGVPEENEAPEPEDTSALSLEAKHLNVAHLVLCAALIDATISAAVLLSKQNVSAQFTEEFLRKATRRLVIATREVYCRPYPSPEQRFDAVVQFVRGSIRSSAAQMVAQSIATPTRSGIVDAGGKPV